MRVEGPYYDGQVHVLADRCSTCVFRPGNLMHLQPGRLAELTQVNIAADSALICHQTLDGLESDEDEELDLDDDRPAAAICRGFFDAYADQIAALRAARALDVLTFMPVPLKTDTTAP